jgi:hypothetical protein
MLTSAEVNEWRYTSTPSIRPHGLHLDNLFCPLYQSVVKKHGSRTPIGLRNHEIGGRISCVCGGSSSMPLLHCDAYIAAAMDRIIKWLQYFKTATFESKRYWNVWKEKGSPVQDDEWRLNTWDVADPDRSRYTDKHTWCWHLPQGFFISLRSQRHGFATTCFVMPNSNVFVWR